jgi:hypothetical protein
MSALISVLNGLAWKDILTIGFASVGAVLGIMNTWNALSQRRVRLVVRPTFAYPTNGAPPMLSISVTNLSNFPLTINDVGFTGWRGRRGKRHLLTRARTLDGKAWPRRLESREEVSFYADFDDLPREGKRLAKAYAHTACGEYAYGNSSAIRRAVVSGKV